jgi:type I restriction enzyme M protein
LRSGTHEGEGARRSAAKKKAGLNPDPFLLRASGQSFYNMSDLDLRKLMGDQDHIGQNL